MTNDVLEKAISSLIRDLKNIHMEFDCHHVSIFTPMCSGSEEGNCGEPQPALQGDTLIQHGLKIGRTNMKIYSNGQLPLKLLNMRSVSKNSWNPLNTTNHVDCIPLKSLRVWLFIWLAHIFLPSWRVLSRHPLWLLTASPSNGAPRQQCSGSGRPRPAASAQAAGPGGMARGRWQRRRILQHRKRGKAVKCHGCMKLEMEVV